MTEDSASITRLNEQLSYLRLLQLADSSFPVGALAHSFGLETLVSSGSITAMHLPAFLKTYVEEAGTLQAVFCRAGFRAAFEFSADRWLEVNEHLSALQPARESRDGDAALGRRFLITVLTLGPFPVLQDALETTRRAGIYVHHAPVVGLASAVLAFKEEQVVLGYLHQLVANLVSASQRLLPVGQHEATKLLWDVKPAIVEATLASRTCAPEAVASFIPLLDWGAMEHPALATRLFIS